jgi:hypothetical protein
MHLLDGGGYGPGRCPLRMRRPTADDAAYYSTDGEGGQACLQSTVAALSLDSSGKAWSPASAGVTQPC